MADNQRELTLEKKEVAYFTRRLYKNHLTTSSGGNVSYKLNDDMILITPSAIDKAKVKTSQIGVISVDGTSRTKKIKPSIETQMHLSIYRSRPDIKAIVHAHPPYATSFTASDADINCTLIAEARAILGSPLRADYALMGTPKLAALIAETARKTNVILMQNHGIICLGETLLEAFDRMEVLESAAKMTLIVKQLGEIKPLSAEQIEEMDLLVNKEGKK